MPLYPLRISSTVDRMEKSKTSVCCELVSKTLSNVNAPDASLDYDNPVSTCDLTFYPGKPSICAGTWSYINAASVLCFKVHNRLSPTCELGLVWRSESRNHWLRQISFDSFYRLLLESLKPLMVLPVPPDLEDVQTSATVNS